MMESEQAKSPATPRLKIDIDIEVNGQKAFRAHLDAEGDAQSLRLLAEQLSVSFARAIEQNLGSTVVADAAVHPQAETQAQPQPAASSVSLASYPPPASLTTDSPTTSQKPPATTARQPRSALPVWLIDNRWLTLGFGGMLVLAAVVVSIVFPPLVPRAQRIEVFMMSLAFGLVGSATLFAGALPRRNLQPNLAATTSSSMISSTVSPTPTSSPSKAMARPISAATGATSKLVLDARRRALLQAQESRKPLGALWGFGFGVLFLVAGIVAPFVLGQASADERFLMMLGFAPVAITGALMIGLFWRTLSRVATPDGKAMGPAGFRIGVPVAIGLLLVVLFVVIGLVLLGTLLPILSR